MQRQPYEVVLRAPRQRFVGAALVGGFAAILLVVSWFSFRIALRFQPLPWVWAPLLISGMLGVWLFSLALAVVFRCSRIEVPIDPSNRRRILRDGRSAKLRRGRVLRQAGRRKKS